MLTRSKRRFVCASLVVAVAAGFPARSATAQPQRAELRILVLEGEHAVNIIQQKTAVAPVVEVRDRNDQPVVGAIVNFAIRGGRALSTLPRNCASRAEAGATAGMGK